VSPQGAILWNDTRIKQLKLENEKELEDICISNKATPIFTGASTVLLKWLLEKEPEAVKNISFILHCKDWLNYKLTGRITTDYTDASTALLNVFDKVYADEILEALGLGDFKNLFPVPVPSGRIIGAVTSKAGLESGIPENVPVIAGAIDVAAVAFGVGIKESGESCTIVGTTLCNEMILDKPMVNHDDTRGSNLCYVVPEKYLRVMATQNGTPVLDRTMKLLADGLSFKDIEQKIVEIPIGSDGVLMHPYFYGERAPFKNPMACAGLYGLTARHDRFHILRAAYESLALSLYDCYEAFPAVGKTELVVSGGGAESDVLCRMFADSLGVPVKRPLRKENGIHGISKLVGISLGIADFSKTNHYDYDTFFPDMDNHKKYNKLYRLYDEVRKSMENYWLKRSESEIDGENV